MNTKVFKFLQMIVSFKKYDIEGGQLVIDELKEGAEAMFIGEDGELVPANDGTYETEDGKITVTDGKVSAIEVIEEPKEDEVEETTEETPEEPVEVTEEPIVEPEEITEDVVEEPVEDPMVNPELEEAKRLIEEKDAKIAELEARIAELEAELNKPVEEPIRMNAVAKPSMPTVKDNQALKYFQ